MGTGVTGGYQVEADIHAVERSSLLCLDADAFESVLGPYMKLLEAHYNEAILSQVT